MARNIRLAATAVGTYPVGLDNLQSPFNASVGVDVSQATGVTYTVQYTLSDLNDPTVTTPLWRADTTLGTAQTTSGTSQYTTPAMFIRLNISAISTGTVYFEIVQGMSSR